MDLLPNGHDSTEYRASAVACILPRWIVGAVSQGPACVDASYERLTPLRGLAPPGFESLSCPCRSSLEQILPPNLEALGSGCLDQTQLNGPATHGCGLDLPSRADASSGEGPSSTSGNNEVFPGRPDRMLHPTRFEVRALPPTSYQEMISCPCVSVSSLERSDGSCS